MKLRKLARLCEHDRLEAHHWMRYERGVSAISIDCPGGVFLPDDTLIIEKVDGEWPQWAVDAIYNGPYTEHPREILDALQETQ